MCGPNTIHTYEIDGRKVTRGEYEAYCAKQAAKRRAAVLGKCPGLLAIDAAIVAGQPIGRALLNALPEVRKHNLAAADTIEKLLAVEGWTEADRVVS